MILHLWTYLNISNLNVWSILSANKENKSEEKVKRVKEDFSKKLSSLQTELKKMQALKKQHTQAMRNQAQYERQVQQLKNEVTDMKRTKVSHCFLLGSLKMHVCSCARESTLYYFVSIINQNKIFYCQ